MAAGLRVGLAHILYSNTGSYGSPVWTAIPITIDVTLALEKNMAEFASRGGSWDENLPTTKKGPLSFNILKDTSDTNYGLLRDAFLNDTVLDIAEADGPIATTGTEYFRADYLVSKFSRGEPLKEAATVDVEALIARSVNPRGFITVGS